MTWIRAEEWAGEPYVARGGEDELIAALEQDRRRIVVLVGPPGVASRLARELARRWRGPAWSAGAGASARELDALLAGVDGAPMVILDGAAARAGLGELAMRRLHPRLRIVVPCDPATAPDVPELASTPRGSIVVAVVDGEALEAPPRRDGPPAMVGAEALDELDVRVEDARRRRDKPALAAALGELVATSTEPARRARARAWLASLTRDLALAEAAVADARIADPVTLAGALATLADLRGHLGDPAGARAAYDEAAALHDADGAIGRAALVRTWAATIAAEAADFDGAIALIARAIADRLAIGDVLGASLALGRQARWEVERGRDQDARAAAAQAGELAAAIDDPRGVGYAAWFLGALAERGGDGQAAMRHYQASLDAYVELGDVPDRVIASLATLQRAYDGTPAPLPEPAPAPAPDPLVPFGRRS